MLSIDVCCFIDKEIRFFSKNYIDNISMKNLTKALSILAILFCSLGCGETNSDDSNPDDGEQEQYESAWSYDGTYHFHKNVDSSKDSVSDKAGHDFNEWQIIDTSLLDTNAFDAYVNVKIRTCKVCSYTQVEGNELRYNNDFNMFDALPKIYFVTDQGTSFATTPTDKTDKPEVDGTYSISNCPDEYKLDSVLGKMKVRGNQTARFSKKGFRIKFDAKQNLLGLNKGNKYKKWVLLAEAKDSSLLRNSLGLYLSKHIYGNNVFVSDFVPVNLYINSQYWGVYILAEQKEVKEGRVNLPEVEENYQGTDIGYCFELDNYASREDTKDDGDPTFKVTYKPKEISYTAERGSSNVLQHGYTMLSEITNKDAQLPYIKNRVETLYTILYNAAKNNKPQKIENETVVVDSSESDLEKALADYFDIDSFVESYLFNEIACNPDVGYSSFFMSLDMSSSGNKKLRADVPWDFDSSFGIRANCMESAKGLYVNRCTNMWLNLFSKLDFFMVKVKAKWETIRNEFLFENAIHMVDAYSKQYEESYNENFTRWPQCIGSKSDAKSELTSGYLKVKNQTEAKELLVNWLKKRINNLETEFGSGRPSI